MVFGIIYCLISLVNHYNYRTYAFDLGIYNNCLYQYGHFHKNHYPYLHHMFTNFLSDHFSLYTVILSPLYYILGTPTLLYIQIISILFGSVGVYKIIKHRFNQPFLPEIAMIHYLSFFGIYSALAFDYHDNVVSAMLVPWFLYYFDLKNIKWTIVFAILIVIGKENMPIWLAFVCFGLSLLSFKDKTKRNLALIIAFASLIYVVVIIKFVMPAMDPMVAKNGYNAFQYSILGNSSKEIITNLIHDPLKIFRALFYSHIEGAPELKNIKFELYTCLLFSGGWMLLLRPQYLVMLIPIIAQKVFSDDFGKWGISCHYSIEFVPIVVLCFYDGIRFLKNHKIKLTLAILVCFLTIKTTYDKMEIRDSFYYDKLNGCFYLPEHYKCVFNRKEVKRVMKLIPENANLSSLNVFAAHLSFRKNIYQYPDVHDAEYVLLASAKGSYPVRGFELETKIKEYKQSTEWETLSASKGIYLFRKRK
ncbi:MAG: DUF2079 domain-containing protein [Burkholderiales bacterium]|nr:DUF2079 domain-containing protein [Bacteroidia bacterium]